MTGQMTWQEQSSWLGSGVLRVLAFPTPAEEVSTGRKMERTQRREVVGGTGEWG